jgi:hypothetical protein
VLILNSSTKRTGFCDIIRIFKMFVLVFIKIKVYLHLVIYIIENFLKIMFRRILMSFYHLLIGEHALFFVDFLYGDIWTLREKILSEKKYSKFQMIL